MSQQDLIEMCNTAITEGRRLELRLKKDPPADMPKGFLIEEDKGKGRLYEFNPWKVKAWAMGK